MQENINPYGTPAAPQGKSGLAIASLVLGIVALVTSFLPVFNNISFFIALVGAVLGIVGLVGVCRGKKSGKGMAIAALVINIVAIVAVLAVQAAWVNAIDSAVSGPQASKSATVDTSNLAVGDTLELENGLSVTVTAVETGLTTSYSDDVKTGVSVTYVNNGTSEASFNTYDWKGQDANGALSYSTYYTESTNALNSGELAAGGSTSGTVYFDGDISKVLYYSSMLSDSAAGTWNL